ncbi:MAG: hypothetical protein NWF14_03610 [Candidatus Bathyarchaeota archaeon]|nr:hypothetical protein [Candidatus Bathyarchaeota archaeon]
MNEENKLKVHLEFGGTKADFKGDVNEVFEAIVRFLTQIYPNLEVLQKVVYAPDLTRLAEKLAGLVEITSEGPVLASNLDLLSKNAACIVLLGAHVGNQLRKMPKETLSSSDLAKITGKARKTIANEMLRLLSDGLVERTPDGEYRITVPGIRKTEDAINEYRM